jgi:cobalt/nickel transport system ATP-binding protein
MSVPVFEARNLHFDYEGIVAIHDMSLSINQGERVALVGANGSGKSTLLRLFDALCFPSSGELLFFGEHLTQQRLNEATFSINFRRRVGLVFQNPDVQLFNPTVFDEVAYGPLQMGWQEAEIRDHVRATLDFMGISHLQSRPPFRLSGGEKKRVSLASIIVLDPEVLLLDEPTSTLDPKTSSQLVDLIQQWKGTSKTVLTATHQLDIVEDIADRILVLDGGAILADGTPAAILSSHDLLLKANLIHAHRHSHGSVVHTHPHSHRHSHDEHE